MSAFRRGSRDEEKSTNCGHLHDEFSSARKKRRAKSDRVNAALHGIRGAVRSNAPTILRGLNLICPHRKSLTGYIGKKSPVSFSQLLAAITIQWATILCVRNLLYKSGRLVISVTQDQLGENISHRLCSELFWWITTRLHAIGTNNIRHSLCPHRKITSCAAAICPFHLRC